jgi:hypothetical protein
MFDGLIAWLSYVIIGASGLTLVCGVLLAAGRRWGPPNLRARLKSLPLGCALPVLFLLVVITGVAWGLRPVKQPDSLKTIAAYSVSLTSEKDRSDFLRVLRAAANDQGMHVDAGSRQELEALAKDIPEASMTIHAAVWKDQNDKEPVADVMDLGHLHDAWIMFSKGTDPQFNAQFRGRVMREIMRRWPDTLSLPIMPTGAIPNPGDMIRTPGGYKVNPAAASKYASEGPKT